MEITDLLREYNIEYRESGEHQHTTEGWISLDCCWCSPNSQRFRLGYNLNGHYMNCWACGTKPLSEYLHIATEQSWDKCKEMLSDLGSFHVKAIKQKGKFKLPIGLQPLLKCHKRYLRKRGFHNIKELVRLWHLRGFGIHAKYPWRIFIPIYHKEEIVSYTTRSIINTGVRYLSADKKHEAIPHRTLLYGEQYVRYGCIIVEGCVDVWKIGPGAVATFGMDFKKAQVFRLSRFPIRCICFDREKKAQEQAEKLAMELEVFPGRTLLVALKKSKDPGEAQEEELMELRKLIHGE